MEKEFTDVYNRNEWLIDSGPASTIEYNKDFYLQFFRKYIIDNNIWDVSPSTEKDVSVSFNRTRPRSGILSSPYSGLRVVMQPLFQALQCQQRTFGDRHWNTRDGFGPRAGKQDRILE